MKKKILVMASFLVLFLLSFRFFFQTEGIVGHNWDWVFPSMNIFSEKLNILSIFTWSDYNLGGIVDLTIVHLFPTTFFLLIGKMLDIKTLLFLLFFLIVFVSFISFKKLLDFLLGKSFLNYIPSFLYAYSPFLFNDIIGGAWVMWVSYSLCPIYFVFVLKYLKTDRIKYLFLSLLISIFTIISFQNFVLINLLISLYLIYEIIIVGNEEFKNIFNKLFIFSVLIILINVYWILPFSYTFTNFTRNVILLDVGTHAFDSIKNSKQSIWNIFNLGGYHDRNMYLYVFPPALKFLFQFAVGLAWLVVLRFLVLEKNRIIKQKVIFWMLSLLVLIPIVKGGNSPFSGFTLWLYYSFPLMKLFRSHLHLMLIPAFIIPILLAFSLSYYYKNLKFKKVVLAIFALVVAIWISGWWYNGDLGHKTLLAQKRDHIDFYRLPPELIRYYEESQRDKLNYRSFFLPAVFSPIYLKTEYQNKAQGVQPEYLYLNKPTFTSESNNFADNVEVSFCKETNFNYIRFLSLFSVKNIILRSDIYPLYTKSANCWDDDYVRTRLDSSVALEKFLVGRYASAYKIKDDYYLPHFYVAFNSVYYKGDTEKLSEVINSPDYQLGKVIYVDDPLSLKSKNYQKEIAEQAETILIKAQPKVKIADEELGNFRSQDYIELPFAPFKPGTILHKFSLQREKLEVSRGKQPYVIIEKRLLLSNKRISELLKYGTDDHKVVDFFLKEYPKEMKAAFFELEKMKKDNDTNFLKALAQARSTFEWQMGQIKTANISVSALISLDEDFGNINRVLNGFTVKHESEKFTYDFNIPRKGEYEIYIKNINGLTDSKINGLDISESSNPSTILGQVIQYPVSNISEFPGWLFLESKHLSQGKQEYVLPETNESLGKNLISDNLKIGTYSPDTVYKISFKYKAPRDDSGKQPFFSINESKAGNLFDKTLLYTGNEFENFEMLFRSSGEADRAFVIISVPEYEDLKVEKITRPKIMLRSNDYQPPTTNHQSPKITFVKINPTKYWIKVEGAKEPYTLVFSESFHRGWKAYIANHQPPTTNHQYGEVVASYFNGDVKEGTHRMNFLEPATFETWGRKPIAEDRHFMANGYANSWKINPEDTWGQMNYELIVEFEPQRLFYIGVFISFTTLIITFIMMVISLIKGKRQL